MAIRPLCAMIVESPFVFFPMPAKLSRLRKNRWLRLAVLFAILIAISFCLAYLANRLFEPVQDRLGDFAWLAYAIVFGSNLASSLTIVAPVSIGASIMVSAATLYPPALVALFAAVGGCLGELSGYYAGSLGKKVAIPEVTSASDKVGGWVNRYGFVAIAVISFQPVIP
ncbi:MAG: hypothetical protein NTU41_03665, partial [Chloroflexi bacterium]|nr:hypothetical protein [Chloroflexota bacterium]